MQVRGCAQRYCRSRLAGQVELAEGTLRRGVTEGGEQLHGQFIGGSLLVAFSRTTAALDSRRAAAEGSR